MLKQRGVTLLEVLITIVVAAFGILGLASLQAKMHISSMEAYQRAQAVILTNDMVSRLELNRANTAGYLAGPDTATAIGTGDDRGPALVDCLLPAATLAQRDLCEWSVALKGAAERDGDNDVGAMIGARGCIQQIQAANTDPGVCRPEILLVSVAWQGLVETAEVDSEAGCAAGAYGEVGFRRMVTARVIIGLPQCQ